MTVVELAGVLGVSNAGIRSDLDLLEAVSPACPPSPSTRWCTAASSPPTRPTGW